MFIVETSARRAKFNTLSYALKYFAESVEKIETLKTDYTDIDDLPEGEEFEVKLYKSCVIDPDGLHHGFAGTEIIACSYFDK